MKVGSNTIGKEWKKLVIFGASYWFSGIYKIVSYDYPPYYSAYYLRDGDANWGMRVSEKNQFMVLDQAKNACVKHARRGSTPEQREAAARSFAAYEYSTRRI